MLWFGPHARDKVTGRILAKVLYQEAKDLVACAAASGASQNVDKHRISCESMSHCPVALCKVTIY
jgi:hypothetical protein